MKIAIINFSGNVGKTTVARHLLSPRMPKAHLLSVESANADEGEVGALRGKQFAQLQEALQIADDLIIDIGASNIEDLLAGMQKYAGSHEDFDYFVVPAVSSVKQQRDTANTIEKLSSIGVEPERIKLLLNCVDDSTPVDQQFAMLKKFLEANPLCVFDPDCALTENEIYQRVKHDSRTINALADDKTDYKKLISAEKNQDAKIKLADGLAVKRLAMGVLPELDKCFKSLALK